MTKRIKLLTTQDLVDNVEIGDIISAPGNQMMLISCIIKIETHLKLTGIKLSPNLEKAEFIIYHDMIENAEISLDGWQLLK